MVALGSELAEITAIMKTTEGFALFDTAIGRCGIAWNGPGVIGVQLPEGGAAATRARMRQRFPAAAESPPPPAVAATIAAITALMRGERPDLSSVALHMDAVPPFHRRVYELARSIPAGSTLSYGELAQRLGAAGAARAVGQAMRRNPFPILVPCHRVLAAGGKSGGFTANGGVDTKLKMLAIERREVLGTPGAVASERFGFDPAAAVEQLRQADKTLARLIGKVGPLRMEIKHTASLFAALAEAIVYQQLSGKAAATIYGRVCSLFPKSAGGPTPRDILRAADDKLRGAGLSGSKLLSLRDLARRAEAGEIPALAELEQMKDEEIVERLTAVRGIGKWTVEMLLMFRLGRPDVLPVDDYGVRKGFAIAFKKPELPSRQEVEKRGDRWRPYRTVASWYLWRANEL